MQTCCCSVILRVCRSNSLITLGSGLVCGRGRRRVCGRARLPFYFAYRVICVVLAGGEDVCQYVFWCVFVFGFLVSQEGGCKAGQALSWSLFGRVMEFLLMCALLLRWRNDPSLPRPCPHLSLSPSLSPSLTPSLAPFRQTRLA